MLRDIPDYGDHMTLEDFVSNVDNGLFTDDDGHGYYANVKQISTERVIPSDVIEHKLLEGWTHVVWFNK